VVLVTIDVSEERIASIIRMKRIRELETALVTANTVTSMLIRFTLMMEATRSSEMSVLTRATGHHTPEHGSLHYDMKRYVGVDVQIHVYLSTIFVGVVWTASGTPPLYPPAKEPTYALKRMLGGS
jgi:hypothetical protein